MIYKTDTTQFHFKPILHTSLVKIIILNNAVHLRIDSNKFTQNFVKACIFFIHLCNEIILDVYSFFSLSFINLQIYQLLD